MSEYTVTEIQPENLPVADTPVEPLPNPEPDDTTSPEPETPETPETPTDLSDPNQLPF